METYYRVGGKPKRYDTQAEAIAAANRLHARTGVIASVTEHTARPRKVAPTPAPERTEEEITEEIAERQIDAEIAERHAAAPKPDAARYYGEYYRAGQMPQTDAAHGAIIHRSPCKRGLFALVYARRKQPMALIGPFAEVQDAADNLAAWGIKLYRTATAKHAIKADAERGKLIDARATNPRIVVPSKPRKGTLKPVK